MCISHVDEARRLAEMEAMEIYSSKEMKSRAAIEGFSFGNELIYYEYTLLHL